MLSTADETIAAPPPFSQFATQMLKRIKLPWLLLPPLMLALLYLYVMNLGREDLRQDKALYEYIALVVLWIGLGIALLRVAIERHPRAPYLIWQTVLVAALLFREYHFWKPASTIVYVTFGLMVIFAWLKYPLLAPYLRSRFVVTVLTLIGLCYVLAQTLDTDLFKYAEGYSGINSIVEEMMEVAGHSFVVVLVLFARRLRDEEASSPSPVD